MGDYLFEHYGLSGHSTVSLAATVQVLGCLLPIEDVETLPFFEDMIEDLVGLPPPKRASLFYRPRAVLEAVARTYVQSAKDYYQTWCKQSSADFYDNLPSAEVPPTPGHAVTLSGTFPLAPHLCYINSVSTSTSASRSFSSGSEVTNDWQSLFSDSVLPKKGTINNGTVPLSVVSFTDFNSWLMPKMADTNLSLSSDLVAPPQANGSLGSGGNTAFTHTWSRATNYTGKSFVYLEALLELAPSGPFTGIVSRRTYNESAIDTAVNEVPLRGPRISGYYNIPYAVPAESGSDIPAFPRFRVRQFCVDTVNSSFGIEWAPADVLTGTQKRTYADDVPERNGARVMLNGATWCPGELPITKDGTVYAHLNAPVLFGGNITNASGLLREIQFTTYPTGLQGDLRREYINRTTYAAEAPRLQVGLPGFRVVAVNSADRTLLPGKDANGADALYSARFTALLLRLGEEAKFINADMLNKGNYLDDAASLAELQSLLNSFDFQPVATAAALLDTYSAEAAYIGGRPIVGWRTYHIDEGTYALALLTDRGVDDSSFAGLFRAGVSYADGRTLDAAVFGKYAYQPDVTYDAANGPDFISDTYINTADLVAFKSLAPQKALYVPSRRSFKYFVADPPEYEDLYAKFALQGDMLLDPPPVRVNINVPNTIKAVCSGTGELDQYNLSRFQTLPLFELSTYLYVWVPCTSVKGIGLTYDGPALTTTYDFTYRDDADLGRQSLNYTAAGSASGDFVFAPPLFSGYSNALTAIWSWEDSGLTRWITEDGKDVDLFSLLTAKELPTKIYATARPPWEDPTEQELRIQTSDAVNPHGSRRDQSESQIQKALHICSTLPNCPQPLWMSAPGSTGSNEQQEPLPGCLTSYVRDIPEALLVRGDLFPADMRILICFDAVSAFTTRYRELPDGYTWARGADMVHRPEDLLAVHVYGLKQEAGFLTVEEQNLVGLQLSAGFVSKSFSSLLYAAAPYSSYFYNDPSTQPEWYNLYGAGSSYTYVSTDGTAVGISGPVTLCTAAPDPVNHRVDSFFLDSQRYPHAYKGGDLCGVYDSHRYRISSPGDYITTLTGSKPVSGDVTMSVEVSGEPIGLWSPRNGTHYVKAAQLTTGVTTLTYTMSASLAVSYPMSVFRSVVFYNQTTAEPNPTRYFDTVSGPGTKTYEHGIITSSDMVTTTVLPTPREFRS